MPAMPCDRVDAPTTVWSCSLLPASTRWSATDEVADAVRVAVGGVESGGSLHDVGEVDFEGAEFADLLVDLVRAMHEQIEDVAARGLTVVSQGDDAADLPEGEAKRLGRRDEGESVDHVGVVAAVAGGGALGRVEQPDVFVVAQGLGGDSRSRRPPTS
jgi:hypothetical protein